MRVVILTIDIEIYQGLKEDKVTSVLSRILEQVGFQVVMEKVIPREFEVVKAIMSSIIGENLADMVITIGGIECGKSDCVPEVTKAICEKEVPGIAEAIRSFMLRTSKRAMLSRGVAGIHDKTLVINVPDSPIVIREILDYIMPEIVYLVEMLMEQQEN